MGRWLRPWRAADHPRYGLLLLTLVVTYVLSSFIEATWVTALQIVLFGAVAVLAMRGGQFRRRTLRLGVTIAIGGTLIAVTIALTHSADAGAGAANLWAAFMLLIAAALLIRGVLAQPEVSLQSIFGAVSAYLILGLMFAAIFGAVDHFTSTPFFVHGKADLKSFQYFSFTTLTTLGYGDYTAAQAGGQSLAVMEAVVGQIFLATLVARLVAAFRGVRRPDNGDAVPDGVAPPHPAAAPAVPTDAAPASPAAPATAGPARAAASASAASSVGVALPAGPEDAGTPPATRMSPRARARQARRSRLRQGL